VLDNVIFCHQEDSYWPFAEASVLKNKFDDIFEATNLIVQLLNRSNMILRYSEALDKINTVRKKRATKLTAEKERLTHLQLEKSRAEKVERHLVAVTSPDGVHILVEGQDHGTHAIYIRNESR